MIERDVIVVLVSVFLLLSLVHKETKRKNKQWLFLRILTTIAAAGSLACLAFPLYYNKIKQSTITNEAVILTQGFNTDSVNQFLSANGNDLPLIFLDKNIKNIDKYNAHYTADARLLTNEYKDIHTFHLFGFGLDNDELTALPKANVVFHPSLLTSGVTAINWQQKMKQGERLTIQGRCHNITPSKAKIILSSFNMALDSAYLSANKNESFALSTIPKGEGRMAYTLAVIINKDTIEKEVIPVQVDQSLLPRVIMLASSPDFDTKFLQNSLSKTGCEVAVRTTISKGKYAYAYFNTPAVSLEPVTSSLLDKFTVLVADAAALAALPKPELAIIQSAVAQKSMGMIVKADSVAPASFYAKQFPVYAVASDTQQQVKAFLLDTSGKLSSLTVDHPLFIKNESNTQPLLWDKQNKLYVSSTLYGSGKIIFTTLSNTYTWALSGNEEDYHHFWSTLLNKAIAQPPTDEVWSIVPSLPLVDSRVQLGLQTSNSEIPQGQVNGTPVYLKSNPDLPYQWSGIYYPVKEGWQTGIGLNGKPFYWYAYSTTDWQNVYASQKIVATQQYISSHLYNTEKERIADLAEQTEFPKIYLFLLFLVCCGFLWAEGKGLLSKEFTNK